MLHTNGVTQTGGVGAPTVESKFMQNYRIASAVNGGSDVVAVCNGNGQVELFTVGTDGSVWNFYPDPGSDTGYSGVSTGLTASTIAVGVDSAGRIVIFTGFGLQLSYVYEINSPNARWSAPAILNLPQPSGSVAISRILAEEIGGQLYVGVLTQFRSATGLMYSLAYSAWQTNAPAFQQTTMNVSSTNCVWVGNSSSTAAFACVQTVIVAYNVSSNQFVRYPMSGTFTSIGVDATTDSTGNTQIFAILSDANLYHLIGGGGSQPYGWAQLSTGLSLRQVAVDINTSGSVDVFAVSGDNNLYHWQPDASSQTGYLAATEIYPNVVSIGIGGDDGGDIDIFAIGTSHATLTHIFKEQVSGDWATEAVEVPTNGQVEQYISYTSDVQVFDATGVALPNTPVNITAAEQTRITVNGSTYFVDTHRIARVSTNAAGMLSIAQETDALAIPALLLNIPSLMQPGANVVVQQNADVQTRLAQVTGQNLMDAKDAEGDYLLAEQFRTETTTDSMATAFKNCMSLAGAPRTDGGFRSSRQGPKPGVWLRAEGALDDPRQIRGPAVDQHWRLSFNHGAAVYEQLTAADALALLAEKNATLASAEGIFDWLGDIGDLIEGVVQGIVEIVDVIVTTATNVVNAAITFIVNGVTYLFNAAVSLLEQAFDLVEMIFAQFQVVFQKIFEWLGFLFNWQDILRTHEALAYLLNQYMAFMVGSIPGIQRIIDSGIGNLQGQLATLFDDAINNIVGQNSLGGYETTRRQSSPEFESANSNNIIYTGLLNNATGATLKTSLVGAVDTDPLKQFMQQLQTFIKSVESDPAFASAASYFNNLGGNPDQIFTQLFAGLLRIVQGLINAVLSGVQAIADAMLGIVQSLLSALQALLTEAWNIPFLSPFYSWITNGSTLTTIDLIALIAAVPTTVVYKAIYSVAPFPDEASVTAFTSSFNAQSMITAAGLGSTRPAVRKAADVAEGGLLPPTMNLLVSVGGLVSSLFYGGITAVLDALPKDPTGDLLTKAAFVLELSAQVCGFPWFGSSAAPDCTTANGTAATRWIYQNLGVLMDAVFIFLQDKMPENSDDIGVIAAFVYGFFDVPLSIIASIPASPAVIVGNTLILVPELSKLLRLNSVVAATEGISLIVLAAIDGVFYTASTIASFVGSVTTAAPTPELAFAAAPAS